MEDVDAAVEALHRDGHLVEATLRGADRAFVTDRALRAERANIDWMKEGMGAGLPAADAAAVETELAAGPLTEGQREAVRTILLSRERVVGVEGRAGSGKTAMLREAARLAGERKVIGLAPSQAAVRALEEGAGIPARTLQWFLARHRDIGDRMASPERLAEARLAFGGAVLAVDEASMVSAAQMRQTYAHCRAARHRAPGAHRRQPAAAFGRGRAALPAVAAGGHGDGAHGRDPAPARPGPARGGGGDAGGRPRRVRGAPGRQCPRGRCGRARRGGGPALALAAPRRRGRGPRSWRRPMRSGRTSTRRCARGCAARARCTGGCWRSNGWSASGSRARRRPTSRATGPATCWCFTTTSTGTG